MAKKDVEGKTVFYFSKSKYCDFKQCPKIPWLKKYRPSEYRVDSATEARFAAGNEVGDLAMGLFGDYTEVTSYRADGSLDLNRMKALTRQYLAEGREVVCEAAFDYCGLYCAADILKKNGEGGYDLYEVKSSTSPEHEVYLIDVAYQIYVLEKCGLKVGRAFLITIDPGYVFDGELDLSGLFKITDVTRRAREKQDAVEGDLAEAQRVMSSAREPETALSGACADPYPCPFFGYCTRGLPSPSVFDLARIPFAKKLALYRQGAVSYEEVAQSGVRLGPAAARQVSSVLGGEEVHIDREGLARFLSKVRYPLYFLDFETMQTPIPRYVGTHPYQQIPVQYSLHILREAGGEPGHREFLGRPEEDPRRALAERLVADIPQGACVLAYNKSFECTRIRELAEAFPDLASSLTAIAGSVVDLMEPFQKGAYYTRDMGGSYSIKSVLPALYPDDPRLDYHGLDGVHNGSEAMDLFPRLEGMEEGERERTERALLRYCELDTFAMVKLFEALGRVS